ncbi:unnamed protein product [Choristocarpus tenellus]
MCQVLIGLVKEVLPLLLRREGVMVQAFTRRRLEEVHDLQLQVTPTTSLQGAPPRGSRDGQHMKVLGTNLHQRSRIQALAMQAAHTGYVEEGDAGEEGIGISRHLIDTWQAFTSLVQQRGGVEPQASLLPEY